MKFCIFLPTTFFIDKKSYLYRIGHLYDINKRIENYVDGLKALNVALKEVEDSGWNPDVYLMDNSAAFDELPDELKQAINEIKNITYIDNTIFHIYGKINKGSGLIEQYKEVKHIFKKYDVVIHFEPRQKLLESTFFKKVIANPERNFFKMYKNVYFNTGLFSIDAKIWMKYVNFANAKNLADNFISIEHHLFNFFKNNNYKFEQTNLGLLWVRPGQQDIKC